MNEIKAVQMKHGQTELEGRKKQLEAVGGTPSWASLIAKMYPGTSHWQ